MRVQLSKAITSGNLNEIAAKLMQTADEIPINTDMAEVRISLRNQALHLRSYQDNLVTPMQDQTAEMTQLANRLDETLRFNRSSFEEAMKALSAEIAGAEQFIAHNGTQFVQQVARDLTARFLAEITAYLEHVIHQTKNELGRCAPLSQVYNATLVAACQRVVDPFVSMRLLPKWVEIDRSAVTDLDLFSCSFLQNGFWVGVAWCVLLFLPTIVISAKLSTLYQKSDPYPGPLVEK